MPQVRRCDGSSAIAVRAREPETMGDVVALVAYSARCEEGLPPEWTRKRGANAKLKWLNIYSHGSRTQVSEASGQIYAELICEMRVDLPEGRVAR